MSFNEFDCFANAEGPMCPYCGTQYTADDEHYYKMDYTTITCDKCQRSFVVSVEISASWTSVKPEELDDFNVNKDG